jgi:hypothetical protein
MSPPARYAFVGIVIAAAAAAVLTAALPGAAVRRPQGAAASAPASAPGRRPESKYPSDELAAACGQAAKRLRARLDGTFAVTVAPPFVVAGNCGEDNLESYAKWSVVRPAEVMWASYFGKRPADVITILLLKDGDTYKQWAGRLFNDTDLPHFGYCRRDGTLVMNIATGTGTLVHELTHALIKYDFPSVPDWFNEGLASLHEQCSVNDDGIVGLVNWRLPALRAALRKDEVRALRQLVTADDFYGRLQGQNYAQARYFVMYMQQQRLLGKFYTTFRDMHAAAAAASGKDSSVKAIEQTFGRDVDEVDAACRKWIMTLVPPAVIG